MTTTPGYDPNNIFAKIVRGEMAAFRVYEDDSALAFMDVFPQSEGHTLVIPKRARAVTLLDTPAEELKSLIIAVQKVAAAVEAALSPDGIRLMQFNGSEAGQSVFHIHFHVIPIYARKPVSAHASGQPADAALLKRLAERIAAAI